MAMNAGDENVALGTMARAIYDELVATNASETDRDVILREFSAAIAQGVVAHIQANAEANLTTGEIS